VHLFGERFDAFREPSSDLGEFGVLSQQFGDRGALLGSEDLPFFAGLGQVFSVLGIRFGMEFIPVRLPGLRQQDERCRIGGLKAECQVQEDEGIKVERGEAEDVQADPSHDDDRLGDEEERRPEEAREGLGFQGEPVAAEHARHVDVRQMKAEVMLFVARGVRRGVFLGGIHEMFPSLAVSGRRKLDDCGLGVSLRSKMTLDISCVNLLGGSRGLTRGVVRPHELAGQVARVTNEMLLEDLGHRREPSAARVDDVPAGRDREAGDVQHDEA